MSDAARAELAPTGVLRAAINLSNFLLVTGKAANGDPEGVSPSMAAEVARRLGVEVVYVTFKTPGELADAATEDRWDIGRIGAEPSAERTAVTIGDWRVKIARICHCRSAIGPNRQPAFDTPCSRHSAVSNRQ